MPTPHRPAAAFAAALIGLAALTGCSATASSPAPASSAPAATVLPATSNPIPTTGTKTGLAIADAIAENNTDPTTKAPVPDRIQFTLTNTTAQPMTGLQAYYTMKDTATGKTESYYQKLDGLTLAPQQSQTIYFDNGTGPGHYPENKYSLYRTSTNQVAITIEAAATGYAPATTGTTKSPGTGEKLD